MKILFLFTSFLLLFCYCSAAPQDESQGEKVLKLRELQEGVALHGSTDRDMHFWWEEFKDSMAALEKEKQDLVCNDTELLLNKLGVLNSTITKIRVELMYKKTQLKELKDVLDHEDYKNTGLSKDVGECKDIADYIKNNTLTAEEEDIKLTEEETQVDDFFTWIADFPCDCVWEEWQQWTSCSRTCGGGIQRQERTVAKPAKNGGANCQGESREERRCNKEGCPFDCAWKPWTEWTPCPEECVIGGNYQVRSREFEEHRNGGHPCHGNTTEKQPCFIVPILQTEIQTQQIEINQLKESFKNCNGSKYDLQLTIDDLEEKMCNLLNCKNGGKCVMGSCQCSEEFTGPTCEEDKTPSGVVCYIKNNTLVHEVLYNGNPLKVTSPHYEVYYNFNFIFVPENDGCGRLSLVVEDHSSNNCELGNLWMYCQDTESDIASGRWPGWQWFRSDEDERKQKKFVNAMSKDSSQQCVRTDQNKVTFTVTPATGCPPLNDPKLQL